MDDRLEKIVISVVPFEQMKDFNLRTFHENQAAIEAGLPHPGSRLVFATEELLWKAITPKRLALLKAIGGKGPMSIREAARLVGRDVKAVHGDVQKMLSHRLIEKTDDGRIECYFREVHLDIVVKSDDALAA
jgi:predicted transcriptional regulator